MKNHYEALGISTNATKEEIKSAYRKLSVKFHPDNNNGDAYFEAMFKNIQEAYEILSYEDKRAAYNKKLNPDSMALDTSNPKAINKTPVITYFETDKDSFEEGESIKLSWRTANSDKVIIKPFGEVEKSGIKIFKPKNFNKRILSVTLQATNSLFDETVSKTLKIKNLVTEIDFSDFEKEQSQGPETNSRVEAEEPIMANSMAGSINDTYSHSEEHIETFFSIKGRLRRSTYIGRAILLSLPIILLSFMAESSNDESLYTFLGILTIICGVLIFIQFIKRLHDINLTGWWGLLNLIPYIGGLFGLVVIFIDSNKGPNQFGPDPKNRFNN